MARISAKNSYTRVTCYSLFALRRPRDFASPTSRRGTLSYPWYVSRIVRYYSCCSYCTSIVPVVFYIRASLLGTYCKYMYIIPGMYLLHVNLLLCVHTVYSVVVIAAVRHCTTATCHPRCSSYSNPYRLKVLLLVQTNVLYC